MPRGKTPTEAIAQAKKAAGQEKKSLVDTAGQREKIKRLWRLINESSPEERVTIINNLDEDVVNALRSEANPYKKPVYMGGADRILAFSIINQTEKYCQRFAMTSLIGFLYRMLDEYEAPGREEFISENDAVFADPFNRKIRAFKHYKPLDDCAKAIQLAEDELGTVEGQAKSAELKKTINYQRTLMLQYKAHHISERIEELEKEAGKAAVDIGKNEAAVRRLHEEIDDSKEKIAKFTDNPTLQSGNENVNVHKLAIANKEATLIKMAGEKAAIITRQAEADVAIQYNRDQLQTCKNEIAAIGYKGTVEISAYQMTEDDYDRIATEVKIELNISKTAEEHDIEHRNLVEAFLDSYLRFNPDMHVRNAYKPNYEDKTRKSLADTKAVDEAAGRYERLVTPPDDTFFRWMRYMENNYEELRQATDDIYSEKSDYEFALIPLAAFDTMSEFDSWKRKYADEFDLEVFAANFGNWNLLASWAPNRDVRDFYTEHTEIIKRIIDQSKEDQRMGTKLMKDRARRKKEDNVKKTGPHAASLHAYRKALAPTADLEKHGGKHIDQINVADHTTLPRDTVESTKEEVEVGVHVIKPYMGGGRRRRIRGELDQWKINIPTEKLGEGDVTVRTSGRKQDDSAN